jgi:hypothetical protein
MGLFYLMATLFGPKSAERRLANARGRGLGGGNIALPSLSTQSELRRGFPTHYNPSPGAVGAHTPHPAP